MRTGVIGLGNMGAAMARTLARAGHSVAGYDLNGDRSAALRADGIETAASPAALIDGCDALLLSLPTGDAVERALLGEGGALTTDLRPVIVVDTTTADPIMSAELAERLRTMGVAYVDAPVSGGPSGASAGALTMMVGGDAAAIGLAQPLLDALGGKIVLCGPSGAGHAVKLIGNFLVASHLASARVAFAIGGRFGLDEERLLTAINAGSGRSAVTEVNAPRWITSRTFDSGFTMGLMRKDVRLAKRLAERLGCDEPFIEAVRAIWTEQTGSIPDTEDFNRMADVRDPAKVA